MADAFAVVEIVIPLFVEAPENPDAGLHVGDYPINLEDLRAKVNNWVAVRANNNELHFGVEKQHRTRLGRHT